MEAIATLKLSNVIKKKFRFWVIVSCGATIMFLFQYASSTDSTLLRIVASTVLLLLSLVLNQYEGFGIYLFLLSAQRITVLTDGGNSLIFLVGLVVLLKQFLHYNIKIRKIPFVQFTIILTCSLIVGIFTTDLAPFFVILKAIPIFIVCYQFIANPFSNFQESFQKSILCMIYGAICNGIIGIIFYGLTEQRFYGLGGGGANLFGAFIVYCIAQMLLLIIKNNDSGNVFKNSLILLVLFILGISTQSRAFVFAIVLIVCWILGYGMITNVVSKKVIIGVSVLFIIFYFVIRAFPGGTINQVIDSTINRIVNPRNNDISNGRFEIWSIYIERLLENPAWLWFGGANNNKINAVIKNQVMSAHNFIIEQICMYGIFGNIIFMGIFIKYWRQVKQVINNKLDFKEKMFGYLPLMVMLMTSFTGHAIITLSFITQFFLASFAMYMPYSKSNSSIS